MRGLPRGFPVTSDTEVLIVARLPEVVGHVGETTLTSGRRRAVSEDNRWWLVKPRGLFRRWQWLPRRGTYISIYTVKGHPGDE